jgi:hypothetical protein
MTKTKIIRYLPIPYQTNVRVRALNIMLSGPTTSVMDWQNLFFSVSNTNLTILKGINPVHLAQ